MLLPLLASGQIYLDSYRFGALPSDQILDTYTGATAGYSLRLLDKDYTGNCIMVRRKSDGDSSNIGFVNGYLDTVSLKSFCGTSSTDTCWVRRWHDQSGNDRHLQQLTNASQPEIIRAGSLIYDSQPCIDFDGVNDVLAAPKFTVAQPFNYVFLRRYDVTGSDRISASFDSINSSVNVRYAEISRANFQIYFGTYMGNIALNTNRSLLNGLANGANSRLSYNGAAGTTGNAGTNNMLSILIGATGTNPTGALHANIKAQEFIVWPSDKTSDRTGIDGNINTFYSIY
jgi:hypothetical protein